MVGLGKLALPVFPTNHNLRSSVLVHRVQTAAPYRLDLLLQFRTQDLQLAPAATEAVLKGETFSGQLIRGSDSLRLVP